VRNKEFPYSQIRMPEQGENSSLKAKERLSSYGLENWEEENHRKGRRKDK
jgi:hypothetical protein